MRAPILVDRFGRVHNYLRISITERCNLRCQYCMPEDGVDLSPGENLLTGDEVVRMARMFVERGVDKIRFTGGEPLVRKDAMEIFHGVHALREKGLKTMAITTNGINLVSKAEALRDAGIDCINVSLDTLDATKFNVITRRNGLRHTLRGIDRALESGFRSVKVNCVLMRNINDDELPEFIEYTKDRPIDFRFIEYMPFDGNQWNAKRMIPYKELRSRFTALYPAIEPVETSAEETSKLFQVPGYKGRVGMITSMSDHFCHTCNRIRLTADGNLKVCLFGASEINVRDLLRADTPPQTLDALVHEALQNKKLQHAGMDQLWQDAKTNRPMIKIGG